MIPHWLRRTDGCYADKNGKEIYWTRDAEELIHYRRRSRSVHYQLLDSVCVIFSMRHRDFTEFSRYIDTMSVVPRASSYTLLDPLEGFSEETTPNCLTAHSTRHSSNSITISGAEIKVLDLLVPSISSSFSFQHILFQHSFSQSVATYAITLLLRLTSHCC